MFNKNKKLKALLTGAMLVTLLVPLATTEAAYNSSSDTDATVLDYLEVNKRAKRENALTVDQKQLLKDAYEMKQNLREPLNPAQNVPIAMEGDDLFYDEATGAFSAKGNVQLTSLDKRRFNSDEIKGNLQKQDIQVDGKAHMLQLTPAQARIILDGYKTQYNYQTQKGHMENAAGKMDHQYVKAKRIELYPDVIILYSATATKCGAEKPDYHMSADKIEYYPNVKTVSHNVKYWLGNIVIYSVKKQETEVGKESSIYLPKVGYNSHDGLFVRDTFTYPIADRVEAYTDIFLGNKSLFKNNAGVLYHSKFGELGVKAGYFEDTNDKWLHKTPTFTWNYGSRLGKSPFYYSLEYERGRWQQDGKRSMHTYYYAALSTAAIKLGSWRIHPSVNYSITKESYDDSQINGFGYDIYALRDYDERWSSYFGFHYSQQNSQNSVFDYDLDSYSRKLTAGFSYAFNDKDRVVAGWSFDATTNTLMDIDYYWYHDVHCAQVITRYRAKRHQFEFTFQFNPW